MDTSLTTLHEEDIAKHLATAQTLVTRFVAMEAAPRESRTEIAGTRRRFVSTVSTVGQRSSREIEFTKTLAKIVPTDSMLTPAEHNILYKTRRALCVALAVGDLFSRQTGLDALHERNAAAVLAGGDADRYRGLMEASAYVAAFTAAAYIKQLVEADGEPVSGVEPPAFNFATPLDALKSLVAGLDRAADGSPDDTVLAKRVRAFCDEALEDLLSRKGRFAGNHFKFLLEIDVTLSPRCGMIMHQGQAGRPATSLSIQAWYWPSVETFIRSEPKTKSRVDAGRLLTFLCSPGNTRRTYPNGANVTVCAGTGSHSCPRSEQQSVG